MGEKQRISKGHNPSTFIQQCTFNGKMCLKEYLSNFSNFRYGNCVTFNKRTNMIKSRKVSKTGTGSGLLLSLYFEADKYMAPTPTIGGIVIIHDPDEIPAPEEKGYIISHGYETVIGMKQTIFKRLPAPYKDRCIDYKARSAEFTRSKDECIRKCIQMRSFTQCGCIDPTLSILLHEFRSCDISNETESCCLDDVLDRMSRTGSTCNCPLPCRFVSYGEELSRSLLRSINITESFSLPKNDVARVKIFYSTLKKLVYEQRPQWEVSELLSILGNEFALWLGSSLVFFGEILEILVLYVKHVSAYIFFRFKQKMVSPV
ncbi:Degenerin deg-1 [Araneus ventricosus]|uniref:Degenerin deg-1 n=1 Tax=Araneus ventricosus TaxID=182803 RepID=A0A4Y2Q2I5_ARAVE|nr:Degenerin deg-1 [Araneus ventricosus]